MGVLQPPGSGGALLCGGGRPGQYHPFPVPSLHWDQCTGHVRVNAGGSEYPEGTQGAGREGAAAGGQPENKPTVQQGGGDPGIRVPGIVQRDRRENLHPAAPDREKRHRATRHYDGGNWGLWRIQKRNTHENGPKVAGNLRRIRKRAGGNGL